MDDFALLVLRLASRGLVIAHGAQKLFEWFEGYGFKGTNGLVDAFGTSLQRASWKPGGPRLPRCISLACGWRPTWLPDYSPLPQAVHT